MQSLKMAIVLAGGLGTRLRSVVNDLPKPMAPVRGKPFLEHLLRHWQTKGIERFVLSVGYRHEAISTYFGSNFRGSSIDYIVEEMPMGTGGGVLLCLSKADGQFLLLNGDTFFDVALHELEAIQQHKDAGISFSVFRARDSARYMAVELAEDGMVKSLGVKPSTASFLVNGGVYLINKSSLGAEPKPKMPVSFESQLLPGLLAKGVRMAALEQSGQFLDIGLPNDYSLAGSVLPEWN